MLVGPSGNNEYEVIFTTIILFSTVGVFAYLINEIGAIFHDINESEGIFMKDLIAITKYMKDRNIDINLEGRIRNFIEF